MRDGNGSGQPGVAGRVLRWKPRTYPQVWLTSAGIGLGCLIGTSAAGLPALTGLILAGASVVASGAVESYRLGRRADARTVSEWASARHRPAGEPGRIAVKDGRRPGRPADRR